MDLSKQSSMFTTYNDCDSQQLTRGLLELGNNVRIIKDAARHHAVASAKAEHKVKCRLFLNIVVRKGAAVFQLLSGKNQALLIRRNAFLVLNLGLDIVNGIRRLDVERNGLACQGFDENLQWKWSGTKMSKRSRLMQDESVSSMSFQSPCMFRSLTQQSCSPLMPHRADTRY